MEDIDFVVLWVDGSDKTWQKEFLKYSSLDGDKRDFRYRDLGIFKYWFRSIEKFTPWVRKIHLVTCGQIPEWLNVNHPKINFVKHSDYIPIEYLPTFNANPIELNLHRIAQLSERFVFFNDDMFVLRSVGVESFFKDGLPCDIAALNAYQPEGDLFDYIKCNNLGVVNRRFSKNIIRKNWKKWFNIKYGKRNIQTLLLMMYPGFTGFVDPHLPSPFLKKTFEELWEREPQLLTDTSKHKFRSYRDVNQWIFRYYQLLKGEFYPRNPYKYGFTEVSVNENNIDNVVDIIQNQKREIICLNDTIVNDPRKISQSLSYAFDKILPEKSSFEL